VTETLLHNWHHNKPEHIADVGGIGPEFTVPPGQYRLSHDATLKITLQALVSRVKAVTEEVPVHKRYGRTDMELREVSPATSTWSPLTMAPNGAFSVAEPTTVRVSYTSGKGAMSLYQVNA